MTTRKRGALDLHPRVAAGGLAANLSLIILWAVSYWIVVPVEVGAAFTGVLTFAAGYLVTSDA